MIRGADRLVCLLLSSGAVLVPETALADTGPGTTGGQGADPGISPLSQVLDLALPLVAVAVAIAVVIGLAYLVARQGGPAAAPTAAAGTAEPKSPRSVTGSVLSGLAAVGAIVVGVLVGRAIAYQGSVGGLGGALGAGLLTLILVVVVVALALVGLIATGIRHGHVSRAIGTILASAGLLATGASGGYATAAALGGRYHEPVVLASTGQAQAALQAGTVPFVAGPGGPADCRSVPDGVMVAGVTALDLGELGSGTLRAMLGLPGQPSDGSTVDLFIDGADLPEGSPQLSWSGPAQVIELGPDSTSGVVQFASLGLSNPDAKGTPAASAAASGWPATISGSLSWTCQPWAMPLPGSVAPPPSNVP